MPIDKSRKTAVTFALGAAQMLSWGSTYYLPAVLAVQMADSVGIATDMVYAVFSGAMLLSAFLGPAAGRRIDRIGGRSVLAISSIIFAVGLVLIGSAENVGLFVLGWLVIGLGMGIGLYEAAFSTLAVIYGKESKNAIMAITLIAGFASTVCWPITTIVSAEWGWRLTCYFWALVNLGLVLPLYLFMIPTSRSVPEAVATDEREPAVNLYSWPMFMLAISFSAILMTSTIMAAHLPRILELAGATTTMAIAAGALVGPAQVIIRVLHFSVMRKVHPLISARLAVLTHPIGAVLVLVFGAPASYAFAILHGVGNGEITVVRGTLPLLLFGPVGYGRRQGFLSVPTRFAQAIAPFLFAVLIERFGHYVLIVSSGLCLLSFLALLGLKYIPDRFGLETDVK